MQLSKLARTSRCRPRNKRCRDHDGPQKTIITKAVHTAQAAFLGAHDFLTMKLCGAIVTDAVTAATTGLIGMNSDYCFDELGTMLPELKDKVKDLLPPIVPAHEVVGHISETAATALRLPRAGIPVFHGCGDAGSATCGVGSGVPGVPYAYMGTSGWIAVTGAVDGSEPPAGMFLLQHPTSSSLTIRAASTMTAGGNLDWLRHIFFDDGASPTEQYEHICELAAKSEPGAGGVFYLPWLAGERSPFLDADAKGAYIGMSLSTTRADMYRAVLEGVGYAYRSLLETVLPGHARKECAGVRLAGGPSNSALWMQIMADILGVRITVVQDSQHAGARGVALLAALGLGWVDSLSPEGFFPLGETYEPNVQLTDFHDARFRIYSSFYPALKDAFKEMATLTASQQKLTK
eukprot:TRINITY_DN70605_c0_g1_i2.p1 TRINITY_DN70605_c0_g1~~TRINITY_DN70605_c0_g1_i2.p1  ORF type:complete len:405 (-),score=37.97 TRINITY_DN70605_c0_g1_i2:509-1723(-)